MSVTVLMVAEKPSICNSIAAALAPSEGMITKGRSPPLHEFERSFMGKPALFKVTSVTGHVFSMDFPPQYQQWDAVEPVELFSVPVVSIAEGKGGIVKHLEREAKGVDYLVLWLDCDREGENICFEVIRCCEKNMNKGGRGQRIFRAKFSAVTPKDIEHAMRNLVEPNENESKAVEARQELDLKVGVAFSRFQTRYFQGKYGDLDSAVISYGPCQTPTLGFCVDRYDEIQTFSPEDFWTLHVSIEAQVQNFSGGGTAGTMIIEVAWSRDRVFDQSVAETFLSLVQEDAALICTDVKISETRKTRPAPMNTVELLKLASKTLGIGPHAAMRAAENLYLSGYLSYPRTESTSYPASFNIREALQIQRGHSEFGGYVAELLSVGYAAPRQGHDAGDHPPITPVGLARDLSGDNARIYDLVVRHFLATVSKDATFLQTKMSFRGVKSNEEFTASGKRELDPGYLAIYGSGNREEGILELPALTEGQRCRMTSLKLRSGRTTAPGYLTESELIGLMEKHGIGTDASIPTHINNITVRNYVTLGSGRTLVPTALGVVLVHGYQRIDPALVLPDVRSTIESFCDMIAKGSAKKEHVVSHSLRNFENKFRYFCAHIEAMDSLFEASFSPLAATGKPLSKCGKCSRYMRYIPLKPQRLYCNTCEETYSLPQNGTIKLYKELRCPLDNFELVLFSLGNTATAQGKSYPLCPCCYNNPPTFNNNNNEEEEREGGENEDEEEQEGDDGDDGKVRKPTTSASTVAATAAAKEAAVAAKKAQVGDNEEDYAVGKMGCNACQHPSCKQSAVYNGMCPCPGVNSDSGRACNGMLVLDVNSKPNWKLACNRCNTLLRFHAEIHSITPEPRGQCPECGVRKAIFEFNKLKTPLPDGKTTYSGCIVCDDMLNGLTEIIVGRSINLQVVRQMRAKRAAAGTGRGGRGRGRGGRGPKGDVKMSFADF